MAVDKSLPLAVVFGLFVGGLVYQFFLPDWYPVLVIAAIYVGAAYFYLAYDLSLFGAQIEFADRSDKTGYAVGVFGLSVTPLALGEYAALQASAVAGIIVWVVGMLTFLLLATKAAHREQRDPQ